MVPDRTRHDTCDCACWHCTIGPAVDRAITSGQRVQVDITDQLVIPDVIVLELAANGTDITDDAGYPAVHRAGQRTCWILAPGAVL